MGLSADDVTEAGVSKAGHKKKFLASIQSLSAKHAGYQHIPVRILDTVMYAPFKRYVTLPRGVNQCVTDQPFWIKTGQKACFNFLGFCST